MVFKIVKDNKFWLHILVDSIDTSDGTTRLVPCDMALVEDLRVVLVGGCCCETVSLQYEIGTSQNSELVCEIPDTLNIGGYDVVVSWTSGEKTVKSIERNLIVVVGSNRHANQAVDIVNGDVTGGLYVLRYFVTAEKVTYHSVNYSLAEVMSSSGISLVRDGQPYETVLTTVPGFDLLLVKVYMGGEDITADVYADNKVSIPAVTGTVIIMAKSDYCPCEALTKKEIVSATPMD